MHSLPSMARVMRHAILLSLCVGILACGKTGVSDSEHLRRAKQFQSQGDLKATLIELKTALQQNPKNSEARILLGELYVVLGNGAAAEKELSNAQQLGVQGDYLQGLRYQSALLQHRYEEVLNSLASQDVLAHPEWLVLRGEAQLGLGRQAEARASFQQALEHRANDMTALLWLVRVALATDRLDEAKVFNKKALSVDARNGAAWVLKGRIASREKRFAEALTDYERALQLSVGNIPLAVDMEARTELAKLLISQRKFAAAATHVDYLLKAAPNHPISNYMAALLAFEQAEYPKARDYLDAILKVLPANLDAIFLLGSTNYALGNLEQAEQQLTRVVSMVPSLLPARLLLAGIRIRQSQSELALDVLEPALTQAPNDRRLLAMVGQAALSSGDIERGRRLLKQAGEERGAGADLRAQLAILYLAEGNDAQAIRDLEQALSGGKASQRERSLLVLGYLRQEEYDKAVVLASNLVKDSPDSPFSHNLLGVVFNVTGDAIKARAAFNTSLRLDPLYLPATLNLVRLDTLAGRLDDARERLENVLARDDKNVSAMMALAQLADAVNDAPQALQWLERACAVDSKAIAPRLVLARLRLRRDELDQAQAIVNEALAIEPANPQALAILGKLELAAKQYARAEETFTRLVTTRPVAEAYYLLAIANLRSKHNQAARTSLAKALKLAPGHLGAAALKVSLDIQEGRPEAALRLVEDVKRLYPTLPQGFELEGDVRMQLHEEAKASQAYTRALVLGGGTRVVLKKSNAVRRSEGGQAASLVLKEWLEEHPEDTRARFGLAYAYAAADQRQAAIEEYRRIIEAAPESAMALNDLAWLLTQENQLAEALSHAQKAHTISPENGQILDTLGWLTLKQGKVEDALVLLRQAVEKIPASAEAQYHLAVGLMQSGKQAEARQILEKILRSGIPFPGREDARKML